MTRLGTLVFFLTMLVVYAAQNISLDAQAKAPAKQPASIAVSVSPQEDSFAADEKPWAILTVKNISNRDVSLRTDMLDYRVHVEGEKGEPPKTSYHRSLRGEFQPGDKDLAYGGPVDRIPPGGSEVQKVRFVSLLRSQSARQICSLHRSAGPFRQTRHIRYLGAHQYSAVHNASAGAVVTLRRVVS